MITVLKALNTLRKYAYGEMSLEEFRKQDQIVSEEKEILRIKVSVVATMEDRSRTELVFSLDPHSFQMEQKRKPEPSDPTKLDTLETKHYTSGPTVLSLSGTVVENRKYRWPK